VHSSSQNQGAVLSSSEKKKKKRNREMFKWTFFDTTRKKYSKPHNKGEEEGVVVWISYNN